MHLHKALLATAASILATTVVCANLGDQLAKLLPNDGAVDDEFGNSVAISGTTGIVGAFFDSDNGAVSGSAYLFDTVTGAQLFKLLPNDGTGGDRFGNSVAISGTTAIVGAFTDGDNGTFSGSAYLFDTVTGAQLFKLLPNDGAAFDFFGGSVAISGTTAIVGAPGDGDNGAFSGSAYLFDTVTGLQIAKLLPNDGATFDQFGNAVAISGTTAIVGAVLDDDNDSNSGSAYLFDTVTGLQITKLLSTDGAMDDFFGFSVAISGEIAIVGAFFDDDNGISSGSAYLFDTVTGLQIAKLLPTDGAAGDEFGFSVAISGTTAIAGAQWDDDNGSNSGSAYLFDAVTGLQVAKLLPTDGAAGDEFGFSVAMGDVTAIVGAVSDDDNGVSSGSAYLFEADTTPPEIVCELVPIHVEDDEGLFQVVFSVTDNADPNPTVVAVMTCGDLEIEVTNGEFVEIELDDECEIEIEHGRVEIEGPNPLLEVFAEDASGNAAMCEAAPVFASGDDDRHHGRRRRR